MLLAAPLGENPRDVAERLGAELERELGGAGSVERIEVAGPGFVNLFLSDAWYRRAMAALAAAGERPRPGADRRRPSGSWSSSSPPTRPARCTSAAAATPPTATRSVAAAARRSGTRSSASTTSTTPAGRSSASPPRSPPAMRGEEPPEDGYEGDYVAELAERIAAEGIDPADLEAVGRRGVELVLEAVRATLERFGVRFDTWFSERDLYSRGEVEPALARARRARPHLPQRGRALAAHDRASATTRTGC